MKWQEKEVRGGTRRNLSRTLHGGAPVPVLLSGEMGFLFRYQLPASLWWHQCDSATGAGLGPGLREKKDKWRNTWSPPSCSTMIQLTEFTFLGLVARKDSLGVCSLYLRDSSLIWPTFSSKPTNYQCASCYSNFDFLSQPTCHFLFCPDFCFLGRLGKRSYSGLSLSWLTPYLVILARYHVYMRVFWDGCPVRTAWNLRTVPQKVSRARGMLLIEEMGREC